MSCDEDARLSHLSGKQKSLIKKKNSPKDNCLSMVPLHDHNATKLRRNGILTNNTMRETRGKNAITNREGSFFISVKICPELLLKAGMTLENWTIKFGIPLDDWG